MSKIICDVCGTSYPETSTQCPICGSVRPGDVVTVAGNTETDGSSSSGSYTYVKGGRFSKANVKKRNQGKVYLPEDLLDNDERVTSGSSNTGLIIAVILLLIAIIGVIAYIVIRLLGPSLPFFNPSDNLASGTNAPSVVATTQDTTPASTASTIPCTDMVAAKKVILKKVGSAELLSVTVLPKNTTDEVTFASSDESVATVSDGGKITAVAPGEAVITIRCGDVVAQCTVVCEFEVEATTEPTTAPVATEEDLKLNREDFTMTRKGETWQLYDGDIPKDKITWTCDDEKVVTVKNGVVTAVGTGMTTVRAEYGDVKVSCIVRCADSVGAYEPPVVEEETDSDYKISHNDVTIKVGETFTLTLTDKEGQVVSVTWTPGNPSVCSVEGNNITGLIAEVTTVTTVYDGVTYSCIVRVVA